MRNLPSGLSISSTDLQANFEICEGDRGSVASSASCYSTDTIVFTPDDHETALTPKSALTSGAVWGPEDGIGTFSGTHLLNSSATPGFWVPSFQSRLLSDPPYDFDVSPISPSGDSMTIQILRDTCHPAFIEPPVAHDQYTKRHIPDLHRKLRRISTATPPLQWGRFEPSPISSDDSSMVCLTPTTAGSYCWSKVTTPKSAFSFVAIWDPEEGMSTLTGARLLRAQMDNTAPIATNYCSLLDLNESSSQIPTLDDSVHDYPTSPPAGDPNTPAFSVLYQYDQKPLPPIPRTPLTPKDPLFSCFDVLSEDPQFDAHTAFADISMKMSCRSDFIHLGDNFRGSIDDEGFYEGVHFTQEHAEPILTSRFSTTTTSTSRYIHVDFDDDSTISSGWATMQASNSPSDIPILPRRLLTKWRHTQTPVLPVKVLARQSYNHQSPAVSGPSPKPSACETEKHGIPRLSRILGRRKRNLSHDRWVSVELTRVITERLVDDE